MARHATEAKPSKRIAQVKSSKRVAWAKPAQRTASVNQKARKLVANHATSKGRSKRSIASYIKRGTGIASYYVAKYTRFAIAR